MSWYSGYAYKELDKGLIVEFGSSYCAQGMNALDWALASLPVDIKTIGIIGNAGDYGGDWAKGVQAAAEANGIRCASGTAFFIGNTATSRQGCMMGCCIWRNPPPLQAPVSSYHGGDPIFFSFL